MYLKAPFWSKDSNSESETESLSAVAELISSLERQRLYREVTLALRTGLSDARAEFSFLRIRGLRVILKFLRSVAESDTTINLFCHSQSIPDLQGFLHSLHPRVSTLNDFSFYLCSITATYENITECYLRLVSRNFDIEVSYISRHQGSCECGNSDNDVNRKLGKCN